MALDILREPLKINRVIGDKASQTIVETDIIVPDTKPDIAHVLLADADAYIKDMEVVHDRVQVSGTVCYKILYVSNEPEPQVKSINTCSGFSHILDIPGSTQGMKCRAVCGIEHVDYEIINERKINTKAVLNIAAKVTDEVERQVVCEVSGPDDVQVLRKDVRINGYLGSGEINTVIKDSTDIPAGKPTIREILRNDVRISGKEYIIADNKVVAKGKVNVSTLYTADDETGSVQSMENEFPFTCFIDLPGIAEDAWCDMEFRITEANFEAAEDSDGELRVLTGEVLLHIRAEGYASMDMKVVADAFSPKAKLTVEREPFRTEEIISELSSQVVLKDVIAIESTSPEIAEVFNIISRPSVSECSVVEDRISLEGLVEIKMLYLANNSEQPVFSSTHQLPVKHVMDARGVKPGMDADIEVDLESLSYSIRTGFEIEIRVVLNVKARVLSQTETYIVERVTESPLDSARLAARPSIIVYFVQPGDTLWDIAKKYYITLGDIRRVNNLDENDSVSAGQQIIIPRRSA